MRTTSSWLATGFARQLSERCNTTPHSTDGRTRTTTAYVYAENECDCAASSFLSRCHTEKSASRFFITGRDYRFTLLAVRGLQTVSHLPRRGQVMEMTLTYLYI